MKLDQKRLDLAAKSVRILVTDAVETSTTGHPGMALGFADVGAVLYGEILNHYNKKPNWINRDRFVLSAGHGAMLQYSLLHLAGFGLPKEELMRFRRAGSQCPGHPEYGHTPGIETTTGPLGAGFATAVGMAVAEKKLRYRFNTKRHCIIDHYTYVIVGDGCLMEGLSAEAASLAGHLKLGKLIAFWDDNKVSIEGSTDITFTEDVCARFRAYGWQTLKGSAHDVQQIYDLVEKAKSDQDKPCLIKLTSIIGKGAPTMQGNHKVHGAPVGWDEIKAMKRNFGAPEDETFYVFSEAVDYFAEKEKEWKKKYQSWVELYNEWKAENPQDAREIDAWFEYGRPYYQEARLPEYAGGDSEAARSTSGRVLSAYSDVVPNLIGGSADLGPTTKTELPEHGEFSHDNIAGKTIRFGVREHAMASIASGITLHGGFRVYAGTLVQFADYMRPAIRLCALMGLPVIYILTHDSIYMGGDGPTHQPIEHLASLRVIPGLKVLRPGDPQETVEAWTMAMEHLEGPTALVLSRQDLPVYNKHDPNWEKSMRKGAYIVRDSDGTPEVILVGSGSEVGMCLETAALLPDKKIRVVSMPDREAFLSQDSAFRNMVLPAGPPVFTAEAGVKSGWEGIAASRDHIFSIDRFGVSGPGNEAADYLGFTVEKFAGLIRSL